MKNVAWKLVLIDKDSSVKNIWGGLRADLDKFGKICYYISNISSLLQKCHFPIAVVLNFLQTQVKHGRSIVHASHLKWQKNLNSYHG